MTTAAANPSHSPMRVYIVGTAVASLVAIGVAIAITAALGGDSASITSAAVATIIGSCISFIPVALGTHKVSSSFGMVVLAASMSRMLIALGIVVAAAFTLGLPRAPIGLGVGAGLLIALIAEVTLALSVLSRASSEQA